MFVCAERCNLHQGQATGPDAEARRNPCPRYLRLLIERAGISQREAARRVGVSERMLRYYLSDVDAQTFRPAPYPVQYALEQLCRRSGQR